MSGNLEPTRFCELVGEWLEIKVGEWLERKVKDV